MNWHLMYEKYIVLTIIWYDFHPKGWWHDIWWGKKSYTYISFADIFVKPIARACCFPSAIIAWKSDKQPIRYYSMNDRNPMVLS